MSPALVTTFVCACIALLALVAGTFAKAWFQGLKASIDTLVKAIGDLNKTITSVDKLQGLHALRLDQHDEELDALRKSTCHNPDCPYRGERRRKGDE